MEFVKGDQCSSMGARRENNVILCYQALIVADLPEKVCNVL